MRIISNLITASITTLFAMGIAQRASSATAPAAVAGTALVIQIQSGVDPFSPNSGFVILPKSTGNGLTIAGIPAAPNAAGTYSYAASGGATGSMSADLGTLGRYQVNLTFTSDRQGSFSLASTDGSGHWANGTFLYLSVPVPASLVGTELDLTPDPMSFVGTGRLLMSSSGTTCTLYGNSGAVEGQGSYSYSRLNPCLGKIVIQDATRGTATAYFGFYQPNTGVFGVEGVGASDLVTCVLVDRAGPKVVISSPANGARILQLPVQVQGTATDNNRVAAVSYTIRNANGTSPEQTATGTTNWTASVSAPAPGTNIITVTARDLDGNASAPVSRSFFYVASSPLTMTATGTGSFSTNLNGKFLEIGKTYSVTALPGSGYLFGVWTVGQTTVTTPALKFTMSSNLVLQATFITNRFPAVAGSYGGMFPSYNQGLFQAALPMPGALAPPTPAPVRNVGALSLTVTSKGAYTAKISTGGATNSFSGQFDAYGFATKTIPRNGAVPLVANLQIGFNGEDMVVGNIGDGQTWTNTVSASRSVYSTSKPAPLAGKSYTFVIPTALEAGSSHGPAGYSHGTLKVSPSGVVSMSGQLADGTPITQGSALSREGRWPLYVSLYKGVGLLAGWLSFTTDGVSGDVAWTTPINPAPRYCAGGFSYRAPLVSSLYSTNAPLVLGITNLEVQVAGGDLVSPFTNKVQIAAGSKVVNLNTNKLSLTFTKSSGLFSGSVTPPGSTRAILFKGVVLQNDNSGAGYFLGTNSMGSILLSPRE